MPYSNINRIDDELITRVQHFVSNDMNSKMSEDMPVEQWVIPTGVHVISFRRILNNWSMHVVLHLYPDVYYELVHDGTLDQTICNIYVKRATKSAVI